MFSHVPWYHFQSLVDSLVGWLTKVKNLHQCFGSASNIIRIRILVTTSLYLDPDADLGEGTKKHNKKNAIIKVWLNYFS